MGCSGLWSAAAPTPLSMHAKGAPPRRGGCAQQAMASRSRSARRQSCVKPQQSKKGPAGCGRLPPGSSTSRASPSLTRERRDEKERDGCFAGRGRPAHNGCEPRPQVVADCGVQEACMTGAARMADRSGTAPDPGCKRLMTQEIKADLRVAESCDHPNIEGV